MHPLLSQKWFRDAGNGRDTSKGKYARKSKDVIGFTYSCKNPSEVVTFKKTMRSKTIKKYSKTLET